MAQCPDCMYAFNPDDPRWAAPKGKPRNWVVTCPGCRDLVRFHADGAPPRSSTRWVIAIAIIVAISLAYNLS